MSPPRAPASLLRSAVWLVCLLVLAGGLIALGGLALAVDARPKVDGGRALAAADIARVRQLLIAADPRRDSTPGVKRVAMTEQDVQLLLDDGSRRLLQGAARVRFQRDVAEIDVSADVAYLAQRNPVLRFLRPFGGWLNLSTRWRDGGAGLPVLARVKLGAVRLPASWVVRGLETVAVQQGLASQVALARQLVEQVSFTPGRVALSYRWGDDVPDRLRDILIPPTDQDRLAAYHQRLVALTARSSGRKEQPVALSSLLVPLYELAQRRVAALGSLPADGPDSMTVQAAQENKAVLLTLVLYAAEKSPARFIPGASTWARPTPHLVQLGGREDFALHFLISAFIAAEGGGRLADAIGLYKEVTDAKDGSGFSFNDLAADRAGTRFGQRAAHDPRALQSAVAAGVKDAELLPNVSDLPEFLPEAEFRRQYERIGSPAYQRQIEKIETRLLAMPLLSPR